MRQRRLPTSSVYANWLGAEDQLITFSEPIHRFIQCKDEKGHLTTLLALLYFGLIFALQSLFQGLFHPNNAVAIVVSTLVIAALFQPLRHSIQRFIDRRFYRNKYDAAKTLEAFSATLRNEVYLDQLREQLLNVVEETMQPAHLSLWLRSPQRHTEEPTRLE